MLAADRLGDPTASAYFIPEQRATLFKLTERYCVVYQTPRRAPPIAVEMTF